jgi:phosphatidylinositol glycan class O
MNIWKTNLAFWCSGATARMTLSLATATHLKLINAARDAWGLQASFSVDPAGALARLQQGVLTTEFGQEQGADEVVPIALLVRLPFFVGQHQETSVSLQWKATFVLTPTLSYSLSSLSMTLNTLGPTALIALGVPLLGVWNIAPLTVVPNSSSLEEPRLRATPTKQAQAPHCR